MLIVQGDNNVIYPFTINTTNHDLTGISQINVYVKKANTGELLTKVANVIDQATGTCNISLTSTDLSEHGDYEIQWEIEYSNGNIILGLIEIFKVYENLGMGGTTPTIDNTAYVGTATVGTSTVA